MRILTGRKRKLASSESGVLNDDLRAHFAYALAYSFSSLNPWFKNVIQSHSNIKFRKF